MLMAWARAVRRPHSPLLGSFHASDITLLSLDICLLPAPFRLSIPPFTPSRCSPFSTLLLNILSFLSLSRCVLLPLLSLTVPSMQPWLAPQTHWNIPPFLLHSVVLSQCHLSWGHGGEKPVIQSLLSSLRLGVDSELMSLCLPVAGLAKLTLSQLTCTA